MDALVRMHGFTLVELIVGLAVIGLAGAAVALTLPPGEDVLVAEADAFGARLAHARDEAILGMRSIEVGATAHGYEFRRRRFDGWQPLDGKGFTTVAWRPGTRPLLPQGHDRASVRFDPTGASEPVTLVLQREGRSARIKVDGSGGIDVDAGAH
ncbi:GspH/FimT family pseudopilin [Luteimonas sp. MC1572]|uniref:GspH/FimT family pseudopilin n=2 Tax=Luteimonas sp. MC1572 TaxID=2799325 RepID=UPI0018F0E8AA|nr:GspH/FimT family pseudopilin [Luteimonas sp. MC1572]QQO04035.1 GspH/FimT family pseudopilin [Luteimonas sp. MC1572]